MRVLLLARYGHQAASSRIRFLQYLPILAAANVDCVVSPLIDDALVLDKYARGAYDIGEIVLAYLRRFRAMARRHMFDLTWVEKEALPWLPIEVERCLLRGRPYVLDFDDAIFHNYDRHRFSWVRRVYGRRIDRLMADARLVVAGNRYLADRAKAAGSQWVEVVPSVVDVARYAPKGNYAAATKPLVVWIGSPTSVQYLRELAEPLRALAKRQPFTLRVIGAGALVFPGVDVDAVAWSLDTEAAAIVDCDVGIMPLRDTPWELGKCAYKLIQYMACGLPTVASRVGANRDVTIEGITGLFADTPSDWIEKLELLLKDAALRERLGKAGRARVEAQYSLQHIAPRLAQLLIEAGNQ